MKKFSWLFLLILILLPMLLISACNSQPSDSSVAHSENTSSTPRITAQTTPPVTSTLITTTDIFLFNGEYEPILPKAEEPTKIHVANRPEDSYALLSLVSLQGLMAKNSTERIFVNYDKSTANYLSIMRSDYKETCKFAYMTSMWTYLRENKDVVKGYILTDLGDDSVNVATSLAGLLDAVIVTQDNVMSAKRLDLPCLLDVSDKDDAWLRESDYFEQLNKDIAFMLNPNGIEFLRDYAIFCSAYLFTDTDTTALALRGRIRHLNDGFVIIGWNNNLGEHGTVTAIASRNGSMIPADYAKNLATLSGFQLARAEQKTEEAYSDGTNKHTVCLVMSDGDNLQWVLNDFQTSTKWYASAKRGQYPIGWGLPATLIDVATPAFAYYYRTMKPSDEFIMQLSGIGYTFPSKWKNMTALYTMQKKVADAMERADMSVMEILDDVSLTQTVVDKYYSGFLAQEAIEGILYIDYGNYAAYEGEIFWSNGKPLVTAKYRLWAGLSDIETMAQNINAASTDKTSQEAYTFVIVHAWSGLDANGNLIANGNTMDALAKLANLLDDDVEMVTPSEFIARITENVEH